MPLKAIAAFFLVPIVILLLTSCGPTESDRHRSEIARQDSLARIRADSIAMAFNQNIDQAQDIRSLMDTTLRSSANEPAEVPAETETAPSASTDNSKQPSAVTEQPRQAEQKPVDDKPATQERVAAAPQQSAPQQAAPTTATTPAARPQRTDTAVTTISIADELAPSVAGGRYTIQLGTWRNENLAKAEIEQLREWGFTNTRLIRMEVNQENNLLYVIRMGRYEGYTTARQQASHLNMEFGKEAVVIDLNPSM
ncbi:MAG: SPOR domain-containing protein [Rhodothermaceae bacterium]|nr:SPOR domain-containing protein [Rhodothermaceae bacterium]